MDIANLMVGEEITHEEYEKGVGFITKTAGYSLHLLTNDVTLKC
jgi:hypothetical protein